ncbi:Uncharacterized protein QTN25_001167 [Entamoeba marina]
MLLFLFFVLILSVSAVPSSCENSNTIQIPTTYTYELSEDWTTTAILSENNASYPAVYLTLTGTGENVLISTCKSSSSSPQRTGIEVRSSCTAETTTEYSIKGSCGRDIYRIYELKSSTEYTVVFYCTTLPCTLTTVVMYQPTTHYQCQHALPLSESYVETLPLDNIPLSTHGCDGSSETHSGAWYQLHTSTIAGSDHYQVAATDPNGDSNDIFIESHSSCDSINCLTRDESSHDFFIDSSYRYIFVYTTSLTYELHIAVVRYDPISHTTCASAKSISVPYTAVSFIDTLSSNTFICKQHQYPSSYYNILLTESMDLAVSTVSSETAADTIIEVITGCYGDSSSSCINSNDDLDSENVASTLNFTAYSRTSYNLAIGQKTRVAHAHRLEIYPLSTAPHSACNSAAYLDIIEEEQRFYVYTKTAYPTRVSSQILRGGYYRFNSPTRKRIAINTCESGTQIQNVIAVFKSCQTLDDEDGVYSLPDVLVAGSNSTKFSCGSVGTMLSFVAQENVDYYVFIGSLQEGYDGMIEVEVIIDESSESPDGPDGPDDHPSEEHNNNSDEPKSSGIGFWGVYGILLYAVYFIFVVSSVVLVIVIYKKKNRASSTFSSF